MQLCPQLPRTLFLPLVPQLPDFRIDILPALALGPPRLPLGLGQGKVAVSKDKVMGGILGAVGGQGQLPAAEFPPRFGQAVDLYVLRFGSGAAADGFLD